MKTSFSPQAGFSTITVLVVLLAVLALVGAASTITSGLARMANRQRAVFQAQDGADSALEYVYAKWKSDIKTNAYAAKATTSITIPTTIHPSLGTSPSNTGVSPAFQPWKLTLPTTVSYTTTDQWGNTVANPTKVKVSNVPGYPGWTGDSIFYKAQASVTVTGATPAITQNMRRYFQLTTVPLMQAAIFYEDDLEIHPGPPMTITGLVHTNADLEVLAYDKLRFMSDVSYVGDYRETAPGNWAGTGSNSYTSPTEKPYWSDNLQTDDSVTVNTQLKQVDRIEPLGARPKQLFDTTDTNANNDGFREIIEMPATGGGNTDPGEISTMRLYNKASLKIEVDSSKAFGTGAYLKVYDANGAPATPAISNAVKAAITSTTSVYDQREKANINVTSMDMSKFNTVMSTMGGSFNGVVYITDVSKDATKDAVRLTNGRIINADLTVATDKGMYIQGDYNTGGSSASNVPSNVTDGDVNHAGGYTVKSTAVAADAVTILSNAWSDANASSQLTSRMASNTTVNTGIIAGEVPSNYASSGNPSGGVHNFPRFLEMWVNPNNNFDEITFTYYGSMVELFQSKSFTGLWYTNNTYWPPNRIWNFDTNFRIQPPPGTLAATQFSRGRWERF